jgi:hypothetical protein
MHRPGGRAGIGSTREPQDESFLQRCGRIGMHHALNVMPASCVFRAKMKPQSAAPAPKFDLKTRVGSLVLLVLLLTGYHYLENYILEAAKHHEPSVKIFLWPTVLKPMVIASSVLNIVFSHRWYRWIFRNEPGPRRKFNLYGWIFAGTCLVIGVVQYLELRQTIISYGYKFRF